MAIKKNDIEKFTEGTVTQVVTATTGIKMTFKKVIPSTIAQGVMTHFETEDGKMVIINTANVFTVEVYKS
jgi:hypothetical protein